MTDVDKFNKLVLKDPAPGTRDRIKLSSDGKFFILPGWIMGKQEDLTVSVKGMKKFYKESETSSQILYDVLVLGLTSIEDRPKCPVCGNEIKYRGNILGKYSGYNKTCSHNCRLNLIRELTKTEDAVKRRVKTMRENGGYDHLFGNTYRKDTPIKDSTREKISKANKGRKQPVDAVRKSAESRSRRFKEHPEELEKFIGNYKKSKKGRVFIEKSSKGYYTYMSSWEEMFVIFCNNLDFIEFIENPEGIEYEFEGRKHYYYPDVLLISNNKKLLIEIKPKYYLSEEKNKAKFSAGREWVENREDYLGYLIYTEDDLLDGNRYATELSKEKLLKKLLKDFNLTQD